MGMIFVQVCNLHNVCSTALCNKIEAVSEWVVWHLDEWMSGYLWMTCKWNSIFVILQI